MYVACLRAICSADSPLSDALPSPRRVGGEEMIAVPKQASPNDTAAAQTELGAPVLPEDLLW